MNDPADQSDPPEHVHVVDITPKGWTGGRSLDGDEIYRAVCRIGSVDEIRIRRSSLHVVFRCPLGAHEKVLGDEAKAVADAQEQQDKINARRHDGQG